MPTRKMIGSRRVVAHILIIKICIMKMMQLLPVNKLNCNTVKYHIKSSNIQCYI